MAVTTATPSWAWSTTARTSTIARRQTLRAWSASANRRTAGWQNGRELVRSITNYCYYFWCGCSFCIFSVPFQPASRRAFTPSPCLAASLPPSSERCDPAMLPTGAGTPAKDEQGLLVAWVRMRKCAVLVWKARKELNWGWRKHCGTSLLLLKNSRNKKLGTQITVNLCVNSNWFIAKKPA